MKIKSAAFVISSPNQKSCPNTGLPEFAFIGRSNVGKSSLINLLLNKKSLAKTSSKPGKTQLINHFLVNENWYLVDLPGYGWSKVSSETRKSWGPMIENYLQKRETLYCIFVLIDIRHEPQKIDTDFMNWMGEKGLPFIIVFTKADKLSTNKISGAVSRYKKALKNTWEELPPIFVSSSLNRTGREEILHQIGKILES